MATKLYDVGRRTERILVATSVPLINIGLERILKERGGFDICGVTENYQEALELFSQTKSAVVMIDYTPHRGRQIDQFGGFQRIADDGGNRLYFGPMVFSENLNLSEAVLCIQKGARAYLPTYTTGEMILQAVYTVLNNNLYIFPDLAKSVRDISKKGLGVASSDAISLLTARQIDVFTLLQEDLSHKEIASRLGISPKTVDIHVDNIAKAFHMSHRELKRFAIIEHFATANTGHQEH